MSSFLKPFCTRPFPMKPWWMSLLLVSGSNLFGADVYRCKVPGSPPQFSQFPCSPLPRNGTDTAPPAASLEAFQERLNPGPAQVVEIPALSSRELQTLKQAERRAAREQQALRASRLRNAGALRRQRAMRTDRCRAARQGLQQLADRKRKGYTLNDARTLAERELALKKEASVSCRF
jgi:hypothetical protein